MSLAAKENQLIQVFVEVLSGPHKGMKQAFLQDSMTIGRGVDANFILGEDPKISRQHIEIQQIKEGLRIVNLSNSNPSLMDGVEFTEKIINKLSIVKIGESEIQINAEFPSFVVNELLTKDPFESLSTPAKLENSLEVKSDRSQNNIAQLPKRVQVQNAPLATAKLTAAVKTSQNIQNTHFRGADSSASQNFQTNQYVSNEKNKKFIFYAILAGVIALAIYFFNQKEQKKKAADLYRGADRIEMDLAESQKTIELYKEKKEKYSTIQSKRALENFTQGFRDYRAGQYARAVESFQVVKNLDPGNVLAERYYILAKNKFDEQVKFIMSQGRANKEKGDFRMCMSNYNSILNMLANDKNSLTYKEAKQFYDECSLAIEGRF